MPVLLLVDDEPAIQHAFQRAFRGGDMVVLTAGTLWGAPRRINAVAQLLKALRWSFAGVMLAISLAMVFFPEPTVAHLQYYKETLMPNSEYLHNATEPFSPDGIYGKWISLAMVFTCGLWLIGAWIRERVAKSRPMLSDRPVKP